MGVCAEGNAESAGETKVSELEVALLVDEEVLRLEVTVEDAVGVAVAGAFEELVGELLDLLSYVSVLAHSMQRD